MTDRELMQMALDALELMNGSERADGIIVYADDEIKTLRERLSQPEREWVGLTDDEYKTIRYGSDEDGNPHVDHELFDEGEYGFEINIYVDSFASAIEAKLKEKNHD